MPLYDSLEELETTADSIAENGMDIERKTLHYGSLDEPETPAHFIEETGLDIQMKMPLCELHTTVDCVQEARVDI